MTDPEPAPTIAVVRPEDLEDPVQREAAMGFERGVQAVQTKNRNPLAPFLATIEGMKKRGVDVDGSELLCDFCERHKIRASKGSGGFPVGAQGRDDGIWSHEEFEVNGNALKHVGNDILVLVLYCALCNARPKAGGLSRVDRAIKSIPKGAKFEDIYHGEAEINRVVRRAYEKGRQREFGEPPKQGAKA